MLYTVLQTNLHLSQKAILQMMKVEMQEQGCNAQSQQCKCRCFALCMLCSAALVITECAFLPVMAAFSYLVGVWPNCAELCTVISA